MVNAEEFDKIVGRLVQTADDISKAKRPAYTVGNVDVLHNFKSVAQRLGVSPGQVLTVYMLKHIDAIVSALTKPELPQAEEITGRFADAINYLKMGYALLQEGTPTPGQATSQKAPNDIVLDYLRDQHKRDQENNERQRQLGCQLGWTCGCERYKGLCDNPQCANYAHRLRQWLGPKATTALSGDLYAGPNKALAATPSDRAQTQALGAHMQRARRGEVTLGLADGVLPSPLEGYPLTGAVSPGGQGNAGFEASAGCSTQSSTGQYRDINVLLFELPQDTSPL